MRKADHSFAVGLVPDDRSDWSEWRTVGLILCLASLSVVGLFWETVQAMMTVWAGSRTFAHGFLVLPATGYLIWCYRSQWRHKVPAPSLLGVVALFLLAGLWFLGSVTDVLWLQQTAFVAMLPGLAWAILGGEIVTALAWPLGFLVFMLPVGTSVEPWLRDFTAWFIQVGLQLTHIPHVYDTNHQIVMTTGVWEVALDCGGLRYLLPGVALGAAFAMLIYKSPVRRLAFLALCAVALMIANGVRAYGVIVGDHFGIADGTDHRVFSYTVYGVTIPLLWWIGLRWGEEGLLTLPKHRAIDVKGTIDSRRTILTAVAAVAILAVGRLAGWIWFHDL
jgi:exosortase A